MVETRYHLLAGDDFSRRIYHGHEARLERAIHAHQDLSLRDAVRTDVTDHVLAAIELLEASGEESMRHVARTASSKHGWLRGHSLYMGLCAAAKDKFDDFVPELEDWEPEYFGWRWGNIGLLDDDVDTTCDRIAELILRPAEVAARYWPG